MHPVEIILAIIAIICGGVAAILAAPDRPHQPAFWAGLGVVAVGVALLIQAIPGLG